MKPVLVEFEVGFHFAWYNDWFYSKGGIKTLVTSETSWTNSLSEPYNQIYIPNL